MFFAFFFRLAHFVAFRRERICRLLSERDEINALHVAINVGKFLVAKSWLEITRGAEQQVFSVVAEDRFAGAVPAVRYGGLLLVRDRVNINARHPVLLGTDPGDPLAVRRPVITFDLAVFVLVDGRHSFACDINIPQPLQPIAPQQFLAVGRPFRRVVVGIGAIGDLLGLAFAVL